MAMNPRDLMAAQQRLRTFNEQHPKVQPFLAAMQGMLAEGTVIEVKATHPDGKSIESNIRMTAEDIETLQMFLGMSGMAR